MLKFEENIFNSDIILERQVLCRIIISRKMTPDLLPEYFTDERYKLFCAINEQWLKSDIDPVILKSNHELEIKECLAVEPTNSMQAIEKLNHHWKIRSISKLCLELQSENDIDELIKKLQYESGQIALTRCGEKYNHNNECLKLINSIEESHRQNKEMAGFPIGLIEFDNTVNGFERGKMYVIGALKKTGKSRFAIYVSIMLKKAGLNIIWNSLEMNAFQLNGCALAYYMQCDSRAFGRKLNETEYKKLHTSINYLYNLDWIVCNEKTVQDLRARIIFEKSKRPIDVVIVDFIQRMQEPELRRDRAREVEYISKALADISREQNIILIVLSQLSGMAEKLGSDEMPNMSHNKESQGIPENADTIITMHNFQRHENPFNDDGSYRLQEIHFLIEQRYGFSGNCFKVLADLQTCEFKNHEKPYG